MMSTVSTNATTDPRLSRKARGLRLKSIRQSLRLSRQAFSDRFKLSIYTLQNWESNKNGGLTEARAHDILRLLKQAGVDCSFAWLMYGVPPAPIFSDPILGEFSLAQPKAKSLITEDQELQNIAEELNLFRQHYPNQVMDMIIPDDSMEPFFSKGDYVAGIKQADTEIEKLIDQNCIVLTSENDLLVRQIKAGNLSEHYHLEVVNLNGVERTHDDVKIAAAAVITWIRKKH